MKHFYWLLLVCVITPYISVAQKKERAKIDTIYAETADKIYVYFEGDIRFIDIGSGKKDFTASFAANCALIRAVHDQATPTSLMIDYGEGYYHGTLAFKHKLKTGERIIDFRDKGQDSIPSIVNETRAITKKDDEVDKSIVVERLSIVQGFQRDRIKTIAQKKDHITISLVDLRRDDQFLYIKLFLRNDSKSEYKINLFDFAYLDDDSKNDQTGRVPKYVTPFKTHKTFGVEKVGKGNTEYFTFAIPYFALGKNGQLNINANEKEGTRVMHLEISASSVIDAAIF